MRYSLSMMSALAILAATAAGQTATRAPGTTLRDCAECPEMVMLPGGTFRMGSDSTEQAWAAAHGATPASVSDESPRHPVTVRPFAMGKYDVTRGEFAAFVKATGFKPADGCGHDGSEWEKLPGVTWDHLRFEQTDRDPVVCVTWHDAKAYIAWLNTKVKGGPVYRLPTEAEWEFAARAGTTTKFWWGDSAEAAAAHAWFKDNAGGRTHPVGSKPANAFGLFDMVGNVWQWTEDCYAVNYASAPRDGSAYGTCTAGDRRVDRGGSWFYPAWLLRSAPRERNPGDYRDMMLGFRVAKTLR